MLKASAAQQMPCCELTAFVHSPLYTDIGNIQLPQELYTLFAYFDALYYLRIQLSSLNIVVILRLRAVRAW